MNLDYVAVITRNRICGDVIRIGKSTVWKAGCSPFKKPESHDIHPLNWSHQRGFVGYQWVTAYQGGRMNSSNMWDLFAAIDCENDSIETKEPV